MQYINGHKVVYHNNGYDCWVVDDTRAFYNLDSLACAVGLPYDELIEVLHAW